MSFLDLPNEVIRQIVGHLEQGAMFSLVQVNRRLYNGYYEDLLRWNVEHEDGSALTWAVAFGDSRLVRNMVGHGADVNQQLDLQVLGLFWPTLLHIASATRSVPMVRLLFELGANPFKRDNKGRAPHFLALLSRDDELFHEFTSRTADLSEFIVDISASRTCLHVAAEFGIVEKIRSFVKCGMDINAMDAWENRPLDVAKSSIRAGKWYRPSPDTPAEDATSATSEDEKALEMTQILELLGEDGGPANLFVASNIQKNTRQRLQRPILTAWVRPDSFFSLG